MLNLVLFFQPELNPDDAVVKFSPDVQWATDSGSVHATVKK